MHFTLNPPRVHLKLLHSPSGDSGCKLFIQPQSGAFVFFRLFSKDRPAGDVPLLSALGVTDPNQQDTTSGKVEPKHCCTVKTAHGIAQSACHMQATNLIISVSLKLHPSPGSLSTVSQGAQSMVSSGTSRHCHARHCLASTATQCCCMHASIHVRAGAC